MQICGTNSVSRISMQKFHQRKAYLRIWILKDVWEGFYNKIENKCSRLCTHNSQKMILLPIIFRSNVLMLKEKLIVNYWVSKKEIDKEE